MPPDKPTYEELEIRLAETRNALAALWAQAAHGPGDSPPEFGGMSSELPPEQGWHMLARLMSNIPGMVYRCHNDTSWTMVYLSEGVETLTGHPREALIGNSAISYEAIIHPDDRSHVWNTIQTQLAETNAFELVYRIIPASGEEKTVWERGKGVVDDDGTVRFLQGYITDISSRAKAESELEKHRRFLSDFIEFNPSTIAVKDLDGVYQVVSRSWEQTTGLRQGDTLGRTDADLFAPSIAEQFRKNDMEVIQSGKIMIFDEYLEEPNGKRHFLVTKYPNVGTKGEVLGVCAIIVEITDRIRIAEELRTIEQKYRALVEHSQSLIYTITPEGILTYVSPSSVFLLGFDPDFLVGKRFDPLIHPDDLNACNRYLNQTAHEGTTLPRGVEYRITHKDGSFRWHRSVITPVSDPDGTLTLLVGNAMDITELKRLAAVQSRMMLDLKAEKEAAEKANRAKDEFLAVMSHEMRTPLNPILGFTSLMIEECGDEEHQKYLKSIYEAGERQLRLIDDILSYTRLDRGRLQPVLSQFNLLHACSSALRETTPIAHGLELSLENGMLGFSEIPDALEVVGEQSMFVQLLGNLLSNACKYTAHGKVILRVGLGGRATGKRQVHVVVEDTGIGIKADDLGKLFFPFSQVDASYKRDFEGAGLGLAICRKLVEAMGGQIGVESKPGSGSKFWFNLPMDIAIAKSAQSPSAEEPSHKLRLPPSLNLLVVDDRPDNALIAQTYVQRFGATCDVAFSGEDALQLCRKFPYDVILMDLAMPGMSGFEATRTLRAETGPNQSTPIVAVTADATEQAEERCHDAGMIAYLPKPVRKEHLFNILSAVIAPGEEKKGST